MFEQFLTSILVSSTVTILLSMTVLRVVEKWTEIRLKSKIESMHNNELEILKNSLAKEKETAIEKYKSQLQIERKEHESQLGKDNKEHEIKFSRFHEKQADVIEKTYLLLKTLHEQLLAQVTAKISLTEEEKEKRGKDFSAVWEELIKYYPCKIIYFPKSIADKIDEIIRDITASRVRIIFGIEGVNADETKELKKEQIENKIRGTIGEAMEKLETVFRKLLGCEM